MKSIRGAICLLLLSVGVYWVADALVFRTGIYYPVSKPDSYSGNFYFRALFEKRREPAPGRVIVFGDSLMAEGFSAKEADAAPEARDAGLEFSPGGMVGSSIRTWYYFLRNVDPERRRYRAIVLNLPDWNDARILVPSRERTAIDLHASATEVRCSDLPDWTRDPLSWTDRGQLLLLFLFQTYLFRDDIGQFLGSPQVRLQAVRQREKAGSRFAYDYAGRAESLAGVTVDPEKKEVRGPAALGEELRARILKAVFPKNAEPFTTGDQVPGVVWLRRLLDDYRESETRIFLVKLPHFLEHAYADKPPAGTPKAVDRLARESGGKIILVPESAFIDMQDPKFYFDTQHWNRVGRGEYSRRIAKLVSNALPLP